MAYPSYYSMFQCEDNSSVRMEEFRKDLKSSRNLPPIPIPGAVRRPRQRPPNLGDQASGFAILTFVFTTSVPTASGDCPSD